MKNPTIEIKTVKDFNNLKHMIEFTFNMFERILDHHTTYEGAKMFLDVISQSDGGISEQSLTKFNFDEFAEDHEVFQYTVKITADDYEEPGEDCKVAYKTMSMIDKAQNIVNTYEAAKEFTDNPPSIVNMVRAISEATESGDLKLEELFEKSETLNNG